MCNTKEAMIWEFGSEFVHRRSWGGVCRSRNTGSAIRLSRNPQAKIFVEYAIGKRYSDYTKYIDICNRYPITWEDIFCMFLDKLSTNSYYDYRLEAYLKEVRRWWAQETMIWKLDIS
jgi:hypothetical protein